MGKGFRPLEEDPSSLQMKEDVKDRWIRSFRPPEGDPSSILNQNIINNTINGFRPPRRGPIFSTILKTILKNGRT